MDIIRKLLILVIILTTFYIIYKLLKSRDDIKVQAKQELDKYKMLKEGFSTHVSTGPIQDKFKDLQLREFIIKSSYNTIVNDKGDVDKEMIEKVLIRGCRCLHFKIKTNSGGSEVVYNDAVIDGVPLAYVLSKINSKAFSTPSPSPTDPLFLYLVTDTLDSAAIKRVNDLLTTNFPNRMYTGKVDKSTEIRGLMGKVIVIGKGDLLSKSISADVVNGLPVYNYDQILSRVGKKVTKVSETGFETDKDTFEMVLPNTDDTVSPPPPNSFIKSYYSQFVLYKFYLENELLEEYEQIFDDAKSAFVPISTLIDKYTLETTVEGFECSGTPIECDEIQKQEADIKPSVPSQPALPLGWGKLRLW
jgi:hypothetical protein